MGEVPGTGNRPRHRHVGPGTRGRPWVVEGDALGPVSKPPDCGLPPSYASPMAAGRLRLRAVRNGGALQLAAFTAVAATFVASLSRTLWRESRPGCVRDGDVYCPIHDVLAAAGAVFVLGQALRLSRRWRQVATGP